MTIARQEAMAILEKISEDKLSFVVQIMQGINGLLEASEKKYKKKQALSSLLCQQQREGRMQMVI